jgi:sugar/nucleoside kinase (ribokinase family)
MSTHKIVISGTGCALADYLYNGISFDSSDFRKLLSKNTGDGGLSPGKLVFTEELEKFAGMKYGDIIRKLIGDREPDAVNVGGPSLVSLIHAAQLLDSDEYEVKFFGLAGTDETAGKIFEIIRQTPLNINNYQQTHQNYTPFTHVFSDPEYDHGHGERTFVNNIGAAWELFPDQLSDEFFQSQIICFGGTGLVPQIHDGLTGLLKKSRERGCITVVNTVFDFRNEKKNPGQPWPLVSTLEDYQLIDLLIMDCTEALAISGRKTIDDAAEFFISTGVSSFIITNGAQELVARSQGGLFKVTDLVRLPVSKKVTGELRSNPLQKGDTTGCGDNFAGGVIASLAWQLKGKKKGQSDLTEALTWGIASGGFCCFTIGGTYIEQAPGEKKEKVQRIQLEYLNQIGS